jgi:hypothetical protein
MNLKTYPFGIFDYPDLFIMVGTGMLILMLLDDMGILMGVELLYVVYVAVLRVGKPLGHDRHLLKSKFLPPFLRAGQIENRPPFLAEESFENPKKRKKNARD